MKQGRRDNDEGRSVNYEVLCEKCGVEGKSSIWEETDFDKLNPSDKLNQHNIFDKLRYHNMLRYLNYQTN